MELKPRPVEVYRIEIKAYQYPELVLEIECGGGTYIRSLGAIWPNRWVLPQ